MMRMVRRVTETPGLLKPAQLILLLRPRSKNSRLCHRRCIYPQENPNVSESETEAPRPPSPAPYAPAPYIVQEEPAKYGPAGRLIGALLSPGETFEDVNRKPTWLAPLLIAMVTTAAVLWFYNWRVNPDYDRIFRTQIKQQLENRNQQVSDEDLQRAVNLQLTLVKFSPVFGAVFTGIAFIVIGGIFALAMLLMQAQTTFKKILSVVAWSSCSVGLVAAIVGCVSLMLRDPASLREVDPRQAASLGATNLAFLLASGVSAPIRALAQSFDVFSIWKLVLLIIGLAAIAGSKKITKSKTAAIVLTLWIIWVLFYMGLASLGFA
jgi:hypothetical protein